MIPIEADDTFAIVLIFSGLFMMIIVTIFQIKYHVNWVYVIGMVLAFAVIIFGMYQDLSLYKEWKDEVDKVIPTLSCTELRSIYFDENSSQYVKSKVKDKFQWDCPHGNLEIKP